jgi:uncharacterized protein (DUF2164 family)
MRRVQESTERLVRSFDNGQQRDQDVEVLLLSADEFRDFASGRVGDDRFVQPPSAQGIIDWTLRATVFEPVKYYLVFRNSSAQRRAEQVDADFIVTFD